jgi:hypothetical protein
LKLTICCNMPLFIAFVTNLATFLLEVRFSMRLILNMVTTKLHYLVPKKSIIPKRWVTICLADGSSKQLPIAKVQLDVGYFYLRFFNIFSSSLYLFIFLSQLCSCCNKCLTIYMSKRET